MFHDASYTYTYILGCAKTLNAVIIDPVLEMVWRVVNKAVNRIHSDAYCCAETCKLLSKACKLIKCGITTFCE